MSCYTLNEAVFNNIENALENPKTNIPPTEQTYYKSIYGPATLMNDWYEKRYGKLTEMTVEPYMSENMAEYKAPCKTFIPDRGGYFNRIFDSYGLGKELLIDHLGLGYYENYTTTNDLMFNHLKKGICGPFPRQYFKGHYEPETDLTNVFGNLTQWGLKEVVYEHMKSETEHCDFENETETSSEFVHHDMKTVQKFNDFKRFPKLKVVY